MTGIEYLRSLHEVCYFQTREKGIGLASNSELGRWLKDKALRINGQPIGPMDQVPTHIMSVVLFPKSNLRRTTIL